MRSEGKEACSDLGFDRCSQLMSHSIALMGSLSEYTPQQTESTQAFSLFFMSSQLIAINCEWQPLLRKACAVYNRFLQDYANTSLGFSLLPGIHKHILCRQRQNQSFNSVPWHVHSIAEGSWYNPSSSVSYGQLWLLPSQSVNADLCDE